MEGSPEMYNNMEMNNLEVVQPVPSAPMQPMQQIQPMQPMPPMGAPYMPYPQMPTKLSCTPASIYMILGCLLACSFCFVMVKQQFSSATGIALALLTPGWTISYFCSQICCFLIGICCIMFFVKTLCKNNNQGIAWGLALFCLCLQSASIVYMGKDVFSSLMPGSS